MTGTAGACCARAASGDAAAKPVTLMRSRRLIVVPEAQTAMVAISAGALEGAGVVDVRFGSLADILRCGSHVLDSMTNATYHTLTTDDFRILQNF